jgi:hypothetical protein
MSDGIRRVETGVAADYWSKWGMTHALKEFVANAKDSRGKIDVMFVQPTEGKFGRLLIADDGRGFDKRCLMLGAGEDKAAGQIGQFKEGMKGAMLVCARNGRAVDLITTGFSVPRVGIEQTQLGADGFVLYVDESKRSKRGTVVTVACTEVEVRRLLGHFRNLRVDGIEVETTDDDRLISIPSNGMRGKVFINGALATEDGDYLFDYNFQEDKLLALGLMGISAELKDGQNRDREAIRISVVEDAITAVIFNLSDPDLIRHMLTAWMNGASKRREYRLNRLRIAPEFVTIWRKVAQEVWPGKVCQPPRHGSFHDDDDDDGEVQYSARETETLLAVQDNGYTALPGNMPWCLQKIVYPLFPTVTKALGLVARTPQDKVMQAIPRRDWMAEEVRIIGESMEAVGRVLNVKLPEVGMFVRTYDGLDAGGMWYKGKIWLKQAVVLRAITSAEGFEKLCGVIAHEYTHKTSGDDRSRDFEYGLTMLLGVAIAAVARGPREESLDETLAEAKLGDWRDDQPEVLNLDVILGRFSGSNINYSCPSGARLAQQVPIWHYAGVTVVKNKTRRPKQTFWFTGRLDNRVKTPVTMSVCYKSDRWVRIVCHRANSAIRYIGNWGEEGRPEPTVTFAEYDLEP